MLQLLKFIIIIELHSNQRVKRDLLWDSLLVRPRGNAPVPPSTLDRLFSMVRYTEHPELSIMLLKAGKAAASLTTGSGSGGKRGGATAVVSSADVRRVLEKKLSDKFTQNRCRVRNCIYCMCIYVVVGILLSCRYNIPHITHAMRAHDSRE